MSQLDQVSLRIGFIGVGGGTNGGAFSLAADPRASAVAVVFSAVEQLRRYFERNARAVCHTWVAFFHELAAANAKDLRDENSQQQQQQQQQTKPPRTHARALVARKLCLITADAEHTVSGQQLISYSVRDVFQSEPDAPADADATFFWVDLLDPPCRVHISVSLPLPTGRRAAALALSSVSSYTDIIEAPAVATWRVGRVLHRVAERTGIHPHNLEVHATITSERLSEHLGDVPHGTATTASAPGSDNDANGVLISRHRPMLDLVCSSREVHVRVSMAKPPVCSVRVVEAKFAEQAARVMHARLQRKHGAGQFDDSSRLQFHDSSSSYSGSGVDDDIDPYVSDPISIVEAASKRIISLRHVHWATTLADLHRDVNETLAPLRGRGFLCLDADAIRAWPRDATTFGKTGSLSGGQVPVFSPDMTLRQVARLAQEHMAFSGRRAVSTDTVQLFVVVNSERDGAKPRLLSSRSVLDKSIFEEADEARWNLLTTMFPQARQARVDRTSKFKKQNMDTSVFATTATSATAAAAAPVRQVRFDETQNASFASNNSSYRQQQQQLQMQQMDTSSSSFGLVSPPRRRGSTDTTSAPGNNNNHSSSSSYHGHNNSSSSDIGGISPVPRATVADSSRPSSPAHSDGTEAFIAMPDVTGGGTMVTRILLPNGFFPLRRLKRFLKLEAGDSAPADYTVFFGSQSLTDDDADVRRFVNPGTNVVFLTARPTL